MIRHWTAALAAAVMYLLTGWFLGAGTGLVRTVATNTTTRNTLDVRQVKRIDLDGIDAAAAGRAGARATWQGVWEARAAGLYELGLSSRGRSSWTIDGHLANQTPSADGGDATRTVWLARGFHRIDITYAVDPAAPRIVATAARSGRPQQSLPAAMLTPRMPGYPWLRSAARTLHDILGWLSLAALVWAIRRTVAGQRERQGWFGRASAGRSEAGKGRARWRAWIGPALAWMVLACILAHGALLRIDAITGRYGPVSSPRWVASIQARTFARPEAIRPASIQWQSEPLYEHRNAPPTRYRSDPYIYLDSARKMSSFYAAHFREPVFPFATRVFLGLFDGQDVAVSFASVFFSVLAIWLTYVLGAAVWSRPAGLLAALGLSLDTDVAGLASLGWRDDAYVAVVVLCAYLMVRCYRAGQEPERVKRLGRLRLNAAYLEAAVLGVASGFAVLTRIMAVPFLLAGGAFVLFALRAPWRRRLTLAGIGVATAAVVAGPYFVNCWRVYGDPLYTFNVHGSIYSLAEGQGEWRESTAAYVSRKIASRPLEMLDTVAQGVTTYPFGNKWHGLDAWLSGLGDWASAAAIAGLIVLAASASGRLLLVAMVASLLPFAFTWTVDANFRFTEHVYPALLVAAAVAVDAGVRAVRAVLVPRRPGAALVRKGVSWIAWATLVGAGAIVIWFVARVSPSWVFPEMLRARESATVTAGARDDAFFERGWSQVMRGGNVSMRTTADGWLSIDLPGAGDYPITLRMDPFPRPLDEHPDRLPVVEVAVNGSPVGTVQLQWTPERVGSYDLVLPRAGVRQGLNHLVLRVRRPAPSIDTGTQPGLTDGDAVGLWYVRVHPPIPPRS